MTRTQAYPEYREWRDGWLPNVPLHWRTANLRHFTSFETGWTPPTENDSAYEGSNQWANISDLGQPWISETAKHLSAAAVSGKRQAQVGHLLFSFKLSIGTVSRATIPMYTNEAIATFAETNDLATAYAYYALPVFVPMNANTNIYGAQLLNSTLIKSAPFAAPPLTEQRAIADYLDRETAQIDSLIEKQERLVETLRERRDAVVRSAFTDLAQRWPVDRLGRRTRIGNGSTPRREEMRYWQSGSIPWLNSTVANMDSVSAAQQFVTSIALEECHLPMVPPGSVLVALTGQGRTRGMSTLLEIPATVNQHLAFITPDSHRWLGRYLQWALRASYRDLRMISDENGSTKGGLTCEDLKSFRLPMPSLVEQRRIAASLDEQTCKIDTLIGKVERFIELAKERRAALITAAVTGQIDVRNATDPVSVAG